MIVGISTAHVKVWHQALLFKLKSYGVGGSFLRLLETTFINENKE